MVKKKLAIISASTRFQFFRENEVIPQKAKEIIEKIIEDPKLIKKLGVLELRV
jgi:L-ribulose-5-phosphate 3-epimerase UlaE